MTKEHESSAVSDETRERFREALERKKAQTHRANEEHAGEGKVIGAGGNDKTRRQFRRKSG